MIYNITNPDYTLNEDAMRDLEGHFAEVSSVAPPKIISLSQAFFDYDLFPEEDKNPTLFYAKKLLELGHREPVQKENFMEKMQNNEDNFMFHAVKTMFLINECQFKGFYSYPQAYINSKRKWFVHPGQFRVKALVHVGKWEQKFIVWDGENMIDEPAIDFNEWKDMFVSNAEDKRDLHVAVHNDTKKKIIEFHVGEDRPQMYHLCRKVHERFKIKPYLVGQCNENIKEYSSDDVDSKVHVVTKNDRVIQEHDLVHFLNLHPNMRDFVTDSFTISCK